VTRNTVPRRVRDAVLARDQGCVAHSRGFGVNVPCSGSLVVHHRIIKGMGGTSVPGMNDPENLLVLCQLHHIMAHEQDRPLAEACGIIIRRR
jgi:hypothetical protein